MSNASFPLYVENLHFFMTARQPTFVVSFLQHLRHRFLTQISGTKLWANDYKQFNFLEPENFCQHQLAHLDKNSN